MSTYIFPFQSLLKNSIDTFTIKAQELDFSKFDIIHIHYVPVRVGVKNVQYMLSGTLIILISLYI